MSGSSSGADEERARQQHEALQEMMRRTGRPMVALDEYEKSLLIDMVDPEKVNVRFADIGGLKEGTTV